MCVETGMNMYIRICVHIYIDGHTYMNTRTYVRSTTAGQLRLCMLFSALA